MTIIPFSEIRTLASLNPVLLLLSQSASPQCPVLLFLIAAKKRSCLISSPSQQSTGRSIGFTILVLSFSREFFCLCSDCSLQLKSRILAALFSHWLFSGAMHHFLVHWNYYDFVSQQYLAMFWAHSIVHKLCYSFLSFCFIFKIFNFTHLAISKLCF